MRCRVTLLAAPHATVGDAGCCCREGGGCPCPPLWHKRTFCVCLHCGLCFGWEQRKGRSRNSLRGSYLLPSIFFVVSLFGGGVLGSRLLVAELRSAVNVIPRWPETSGRLLLCMCRSCLSTVVPLLFLASAVVSCSE